MVDDGEAADQELALAESGKQAPMADAEPRGLWIETV